MTVTEGGPALISSVTGTLNGVAGAWNFDSDAPVGNAVSVTPTFTRTSDKITASMRLLGIVPSLVPSAAQELTLVVTFSHSSTQPIVKDMTSLLANFNIGKRIPIVVTADVQTPIAVDFTCTITNWESVARTGVAN